MRTRTIVIIAVVLLVLYLLWRKRQQNAVASTTTSGSNQAATVTTVTNPVNSPVLSSFTQTTGSFVDPGTLGIQLMVVPAYNGISTPTAYQQLSPTL